MPRGRSVWREGPIYCVGVRSDALSEVFPPFGLMLHLGELTMRPLSVGGSSRASVGATRRCAPSAVAFVDGEWDQPRAVGP